MKEGVDMFSPYLGKSYTSHEIEEALIKYNGRIHVIHSFHKYKQAAEAISKGKIIAWFQGRSECGPRALGNRSILADARNKDMKDIVNQRIKFREAFRPFAPSVLYEYQQEYFDLDIPSPYMLMIADVLDDKRDNIPSVVHVDGTGRLQSVIKEINPVYYKLIETFYQITGIPVILNTSFNINKEPIVESPEDALNCFLNTDLDELYMEDYIITKNK